MGGILGGNRILPATLFSLALIGGAYYLARGVAHPPVAQASTESALLQEIATKDSTGDGLPDWEKTLYGIPVDATTTDYFHLGMTDGEAVAKGLIVPKAVTTLPDETATATTSVVNTETGLPPASADDTLTAAFSKDFLMQYIAAKNANGGAALSEAQMQNVADTAISDLRDSIQPTPDFKSASDLTVSGSGSAALTAFAVSAATIIDAHPANATTSELTYMQEAVEQGNLRALVHIDSMAQAYREAAVAFANLPVPKELATSDLALINAFAHLSEIDTDLTKVKSDPLAAVLALDQYPDAVDRLANALTAVASVYVTAGVTLAPGAPGADFLDLTAYAAPQATTTTP